MARLSGRLVVASHNAGKVVEIRALLAPFGVEPISAADLGLPEPEETGATFTANAVLKARAAAEAVNLPALADDSGLAVAALDGAPGIYSARWGGPQRDFAMAMEKVQRALQERGAVDRAAKFICALALAHPGGEVEIFEAETAGVLVWPPRGDNGFGYDPMFQPEGRTETFGEMSGAEKLPLTHRARAFAKLVRALS
ncbi:MAG: RdgB/HAM1 family non-canonical purine NTP pyrophosphatase [Hyphomonadaceae bacterium]